MTKEEMLQKLAEIKNKAKEMMENGSSTGNVEEN
ncbi:hypothetical protein HNQ80_001033 [Anaerosolibacter carboniphilus]|uniref:Uncharacterized protein n=1 Tax=Anaerosolibacter carboniphilus TaxID=1417629 RepID=A0A841KS24_9FIRM|nr:hypothetical protein [Anaerosolibacter carboniphilus]